jgi:hypothetical protein
MTAPQSAHFRLYFVSKRVVSYCLIVVGLRSQRYALSVSVKGFIVEHFFSIHMETASTGDQVLQQLEKYINLSLENNDQQSVQCRCWQKSFTKLAVCRLLW